MWWRKEIFGWQTHDAVYIRLRVQLYPRNLFDFTNHCHPSNFNFKKVLCLWNCPRSLWPLGGPHVSCSRISLGVVCSLLVSARHRLTWARTTKYQTIINKLPWYLVFYLGCCFPKYKTFLLTLFDPLVTFSEWGAGKSNIGQIPVVFTVYRAVSYSVITLHPHFYLYK